MHFEISNMILFATFQIFILLAPVLGAYVFPDDFQLCKRGDKNLNDCILSALRDAWPKLADPGISSPITIKTEPVFSPYCEYHPKDDVFIFDEYFFNLVHTGFINSTVLSANIDLSNLALNFTTFTTHIVQNSTYTGNGTVLYNGTRDPDPIWGTGTAIKELFNITILHQIKSKKSDRNGETYLEVMNYNVSINLGFITFYYENLFNGTDPEMAKRVGEYVNAFAPYITSGMQPNVEEFFGGMFKTYAKSILGSVPLSKLMPSFEFE